MKYLLLLLTFSIFPYTRAQGPPSFAKLAIELDAGQSLPLARKIRLELLSSNAGNIAQALLGWEGISVDQVGGNSLLVTMSEQPHYSGKPLEQYSASSFVIDLEEESTQRFVSGFTKEKNTPLKLEALTKYVHTFIENPSYINGFNIASVVAAQRSGDCTEYAVLATALARSQGLQSRVVIGSVILEGKDQVTAFGHAWAEVHLNGQWQILDAALYDSGATKHFYLPAAELEKEGPGFTMSLMKAVTLMPDKIRHLRNVN